MVDEDRVRTEPFDDLDGPPAGGDGSQSRSDARFDA
jgi:hypothetical protein